MKLNLGKTSTKVSREPLLNIKGKDRNKKVKSRVQEKVFGFWITSAEYNRNEQEQYGEELSSRNTVRFLKNISCVE